MDTNYGSHANESSLLAEVLEQQIGKQLRDWSEKIAVELVEAARTTGTTNTKIEFNFERDSEDGDSYWIDLSVGNSKSVVRIDRALFSRG